MTAACGARTSISLDSNDPDGQPAGALFSSSGCERGTDTQWPPVRGAPTAPVTMVEYGDFECPYCGEEEPIVKALLAAYGDNLRLEWRNFPLTEVHPHAEAAAIAAWCAGQQGEFWPMHDTLFAHQDALDDASLQTYAAALCLDLPTWIACTASPEAAQAIAVDVALGQSLGVWGTPTFFIDGVERVGALPQADLANVIDAELAQAGVGGAANGDP
jgi:protein-disulfide isomerase